jgi:hypothetical protein
MSIFNLKRPEPPRRYKNKKSTQKLFLYLDTTFEGSGEINFYQIVKKNPPYSPVTQKKSLLLHPYNKIIDYKIIFDIHYDFIC